MAVATIATVATLAIVGGAGAIIGGVAASRRHDQQVDALQNDIDRNELLQEQLAGPEGESPEEIRQQEEQRARNEESLLASRDTALREVGTRERGVVASANRQQEQLLVSSEEALGVQEAQVAASGLRGGQGSAAVLAGNTEAQYSRGRQAIGEDLERARDAFDTSREGIQSSYEQSMANVNLNIDQAIQDIDRQTEFLLEQYDFDHTWMTDQMESLGGNRGWDIASGVVAGASSGLQIGSSIASFY